MTADQAQAGLDADSSLPEPGPPEPVAFPPPRGRNVHADPQAHMGDQQIDNLDLKNLLLEYGPLVEELEDDEETKAKRKRVRAIKKGVRTLATDVLKLKAGLRYRIGGTPWVLAPKLQPGGTVVHEESTAVKILPVE